MTWLKLDDSFGDHPKIDALSDGAYRLHVQAMNYAARNLLDGRVPDGRPERLMQRFKRGYLVELERAGLWERNGAGWMIHDFLVYNPSKEEVEERRKKRAEAGAKGGKRSSKKRASAKPKAQASASAKAQAAGTNGERTPTRPVGNGSDSVSTVVGRPPPPAPTGVGGSHIEHVRAARKSLRKR